MNVETMQYPEPVLDLELTSRYGWISPDGRFYSCDHYEHMATADAIIHRVFSGIVCCNSERLLELRGYLKIAGVGHQFYFIFEKKPTQAQRDIVFDWCNKHNVELPDHIFNHYKEEL